MTGGISQQEVIGAFRDAMRANGLVTKDAIIPDGKVRRFNVDGDKHSRRNGWYILHTDGVPAGAFGSMKDSAGKVTWSMKGAKPLTAAERAKIREEAAAAKIRRAAEQAAIAAAAAARANAIWAAASDVTSHPYLKRKGVHDYGLKVATWVREYGHDQTTGEVREYRIANALLVPIKNTKKEIVSLQAIFPNDKNALKRDKDYLAGGEKRGCFFPIGKPAEIDGRKVIVLAEGYATGASIHAVTGLAVLVVFDAGNILPVAQAVRKAFPAATLIFAADNDQWTKDNPGVWRATEAAAAVEGVVAIPRFKDESKHPTDFNDLEAAEGADAVKSQIMGALAAPAAVEPEHLPDGPEIEEPPPPEPIHIPHADEEEDEEEESESDDKEEDDGGPKDGGFFRILGHDQDRLYLYQNEMRMVTSRPISSWDKNALTALAPPNWWEQYFPGERGLNKDAAVNWLVRTAYKRGFYNPNRTRGRGAWMDDGRAVYHFGESLSVDGVMTGLAEIKSRFVYQQGDTIAIPSMESLSVEDGRRLYDIASRFSWVRPASAILLTGWCAIAPIGGALNWRPHIWITGGTGSGKSTILESYVHFLMNGADIYAQGSSSEAGLRQTLKMDSLPVVFDEGEQNNERDQARMQHVLALARQSSTKSDARTLKGTQHGSAMDFHIQSPFCLSSVQVGIKHQADYERFAILSLRPKRDRADAAKWDALKADLVDMNQDKALPGRLMRRALMLLPTTLKNIDTFAAVGSRVFGTQREGDQYGALLAGAFSLVSNRLATPDQAKEMIGRYDWSEYMEHSETEESNKALQALLGAMVRLPRGEAVTIYELVCRAAGRAVETISLEPDGAETVLRRHGMAIVHSQDRRPETALLLLSNNSLELHKLLDGTPYAADIRGQLLRVKGAEAFSKAISFSGVKDRCYSIPMSAIMPDDRIQPAYEPGYDDDVPF